MKKQLRFGHIGVVSILFLCSCTKAGTPTNAYVLDSTSTSTMTSSEILLVETKNAILTIDAQPPSSTATPEIPLETIMEHFPLEVGTTWVYRVTIEYTVGDWSFTEDGEAIEPPWETWTGLVKQQIIEQIENPPSGYPTFRVKLDDVPKLMQDGIETQTQEIQYVVKNNSIYNESMRLIKWPLEVGVSWDPWDDTAEPQGTSSHYNWLIQDIESVETGLGIIDGCYLIQLTTQPDTTSNWICPGIGIARVYGWSGGMPTEIVEWVLESFSLPSQ